MKKILKLSVAALLLTLAACGGKQQEVKTASGLNPADFQTEVDGKQTALYTLTNANGMEVQRTENSLFT